MCANAAREHVVGWYSTGPRLKAGDLTINELMADYCDNPMLVICEVQVRCCPRPAARRQRGAAARTGQ